MDLKAGFQLGDWLVYPLEGRLVGQNEETRVQPKSMDVLLRLAGAGGTLAQRDDILRDVWGERAVSDEPLTRCIGELRRALGDTRTEPEYIVTVPKRGYRLLKEVKPLPVDDKQEVSAAAEAAKHKASTRRKVAAGLLVIVAAALVETVFERILSDQDLEIDSSETREMTLPSDKPSIAVLPFVNISSDMEQEYFSDGISEELLNALTQIPDLRVISRSSAFSYKDSEVDMPTIAEELNVSYVLEGSVRKSGDQVRVSAQLVEARTDTHLWSETYERTLDDIFAIQDDIAARVVDELKIRFLEVISTGQSIDPDAYALVLQARYLGRQLTPESLENSIALYNDAIMIDPLYAAPWAGLAIQYTNQAGQGLRPVDEGYELAREAANRALTLDPAHARAHRSLARIARTYDRDLVSAAFHDEWAFLLDPTNTANIAGAASTAAALGRLDQAIALAEYSVARDPVSAIGIANLGLHYFRAGQLDQAIASFSTMLNLSPDFIGGQFILGHALLLKGETESALQIMHMESDEGWRLIGLAMAYHALGQSSASDESIAELIEKYERDSAYNIAYALAFRGQADRAFEWLDKAVAQNDPGLTDIVVEPLFTNIRSDPRWLPFLESIGKSPEQLAAIEFKISLPE